MSEWRTKFRFLIGAIFLALAMLGLGYRLAFLHLGPHDEVRKSFQKTRGMRRTLLAGRGAICDRNGAENLLALNLSVKDICADPSIVCQSNRSLEVACQLSELLDVPPDVLAVRLKNPSRRFASIRRFVFEEQAEEVAEAGLPGVFFRDSMVRYYPQHAFMCHLLGFVNHEGVGSAGVEQRMDRYLKGSPGLIESKVNALREELYWQRGRHVAAIEGASVELTVDQNIQYVVEKALDKAMVEHHAKGAWAIVQRVQTGEVLAMASRPAYNLNEFQKASDNMKLNRPVGYVYEPGSTMKAVVFAAALNEGKVSPNTVIDCESGSWYYGRRILRDFHPYGPLTVADGLKKSSNILTAKIALSLGDELLHHYFNAFGLGHPMGIDLPGEEAGILHPVAKWSKISPTRMAIGQGIAVTALQMLGVYCTIANDGYLMRPYVVKRVVENDGTVLHENEPKVLARPISPATASTMRRLLARVTQQGGTGRRARVEGYEVAGKTGTAQKPIPGGYSDTENMASFVGFLPAAAPEIGIIVVVDDPQPIHTGGRVAGPVFKEIASQAVRYLDVPPTRRGMLAGQ